MTVWNVGSINIDHFYDVPHIPAPGETLAATDVRTGLGGKGANQSVAAARAGARVHHIGAVGRDGGWAVDRMGRYGVGTDHILVMDVPTGHAIITLASDGENAIIIFGGANTAMPADHVVAALVAARAGDVLLLQNETLYQPAAASAGQGAGLRVIYSAAPFDADAVVAVLPHVSLLVLNAVEAAQLEAALGTALGDLPVPEIVVTRGAAGADLRDTRTGATVHVPAPTVDAVDTTGAGDTFAGYLAAGLDAGLPTVEAMARAAAASALKVTRRGTADAIPDGDEVAAFLLTQA
ncbi:PfkB family carbohydrate kinase [Palleronia sp. KMU-117]|uniref:PfkB family carbohydrate kinase n=1 Tax=Palleronia sp. KMU-117 TaxID=3434108 RepID=UPI003D731CD4